MSQKSKTIGAENVNLTHVIHDWEFDKIGKFRAAVCCFRHSKLQNMNVVFLSSLSYMCWARSKMRADLFILLE